MFSSSRPLTMESSVMAPVPELLPCAPEPMLFLLAFAILGASLRVVRLINGGAEDRFGKVAAGARRDARLVRGHLWLGRDGGKDWLTVSVQNTSDVRDRTAS